MRTEVRNQIMMLGGGVVAEVASPSGTHRRWMLVSPIEGRIQVVEAEVSLGVDPVDYPKSDDDCVLVARDTFDSLGEAVEAIQARGIDTDTFDAPWKTENPF